jgi:sortase (surface protein transpeptidase)
MDVPRDLSNAAWLKTGVRPGARGQAVIDGHLDSVGGPALFANLQRLKPGDQIFVSDAGGGELTFAVTAVQVAPLRGFPTLRVFGPAGGRFLNLITCAGTYDPAAHTYDQRLVVFTQLA